MVVVDPPRKGCDVKLLNAITNIDAKKIVYVSCDPSTLGRDLAILEENGYKTLEVQPVDMFPNTSHVENVRSEEHTSELQSPILISYAVFCLKKKKGGN